MNILQGGAKAAFEVTYQPGLENVGMTVIDVSSANPSVIGTFAMIHLLNGTYVAYFVPTVGATYVVSKAVYEDAEMTVQDTDFSAGSESFYATGTADLSETLAILQAIAAGIASAGATALELDSGITTLETADPILELEIEEDEDALNDET